MMSKAALRIRRIAASAVFLSIALILKTYFSFYIPLFGQNGIRMGISGVFSIMPAFLFGPLYGAAVSGLSDLLGYVMKPVGAFMPLMTLSMALGGYVRGLLWMLLGKRRDKSLRIAVAALVIAVAAFGVWNMAALSRDGVNEFYYEALQGEDPDLENLHMISRLLVSRTMRTSDPAGNLAVFSTYLTAGCLGFAVFGVVLVLGDTLISMRLKKKNQHGGSERPTRIMAILIAMLVSGLLSTTINTVILRNILYESWKLLPFVVVWLPRALEEIVSNMVKAYFVALLYGVFMKQGNLKRMVGVKE